jgi:hypothetical protein
VSAPPDQQLYVVEVNDRCQPQLVGHSGCSYASPPQPARQALTLIHALLGCPQHELRVEHSPWRHAIAGGTRTITLHAASPDGQLHLSPHPRRATIPLTKRLGAPPTDQRKSSRSTACQPLARRVSTTAHLVRSIG